jgi:hypothetical protein
MLALDGNWFAVGDQRRDVESDRLRLLAAT